MLDRNRLSIKAQVSVKVNLYNPVTDERQIILIHYLYLGGNYPGGAAGAGYLRVRGHRDRQDGRLHAACARAAPLQAQGDALGAREVF